jgi:hypothetical protein
MIDIDVSSGMINKIKYDPEKKILTLGFNAGGYYDYLDVPKEICDGIIAAESKGKYYHAYIKNKFIYNKI